jgi:murein DD-endopeptidase MepM/ murein hydrolase activator NlpD
MVSEIREHRGFGLTLKLEHTEHIRTFYAHLQKTLVTTGSQVKRGMPIAIVGNSGRSPGKTLHYEIRYDGNAINPEHYILYPIKMD